MGLLDKANGNKKSVAVLSTQNSSGNKKKNHINDFLFSISNIKPGFEYSKELFNSLCVFFNISKGALLFRDSDLNTFSPVSFINIDITTTRHLRIDSNIFDVNNSIFNKKVNITDKNIRIFKQYLSIREFSALDSFIIVPFYLRGILNALLFIIDPSTELVSNANEISLNSEIFTNKLIKSQKPFNNVLKSSIKESKSEPVYSLQNYFELNQLKDVTFLIITINFTELKDFLISQLSDSDTFEISNNIFKSITLLISPTGKLVKLSSENYLLFYIIKKGKTSGIILHQINLAIASFFNISKTLPKIETQIKSFQKNEYESAKIMLEGII